MTEKLSRSRTFRMGVDGAMTLALLLLMAYEMAGRAAHEWIGMGMALLLIIHHVLNRNWSRNLFRGSWSRYRTVQTALVVLAFLSMMGSMVSGIVLSEYVFAFLPIRGGYSLARTVHMVCGYWNFVLMSLHLGLHWGMMIRTWHVRPAVMRTVGAAVALYGLYAFFKRGIPDYLFLRTHFAFFDFDEPLVLFLIDYLAAMGFFVWLGHYCAGWLYLFPHAEVIVQEKEFSAAFTYAFQQLDQNGHTLYMRQDLDVPVERYTLINGDYEVCPGVTCISLPGHSAGMMGLMVETDHSGPWFFVRDAAYLPANYGPPSVPSSFVYNLEDYYKSHERIRAIERETKAAIVMSHDLRQWNSMKHAPEYYD